MTDPIGALPASPALAEASPDSLAEAISRYDRAVQAGQQGGPEARRSLEAIVLGLREQRRRWEAAEAGQPVRQVRGKGPLSLKVAGKIEDLGL